MNDLSIDPNELDDRRTGIIKRIHERVLVVDNGFSVDRPPATFGKALLLVKAEEVAMAGCPSTDRQWLYT